MTKFITMYLLGGVLMFVTLAAFADDGEFTIAGGTVVIEEKQ